MAGLLTGDIAKAIYAGFRGKLLKGTLQRYERDPKVQLDELGDPKDRVPKTYKCEGFVDAYSKSAKGRDQIPEGDLRTNIFAASLPKGIRPQMDDRVTFTGRAETLILRDNVSTDPAEALWVCQSYPLKPQGDAC